MSRFTILLGGRVVVTPRLLAQIANSRVIAADSGMVHAASLAVLPELWVGDFDSASDELQQKFQNVTRLNFPEAKDATDGELAISEAFRRGATALILVGGFGGRADHSFAHVLQLVEIASRGADVMLTSGDEEAYLLNGSLVLSGLTAGTRLSILPVTNLSGLTIENLRWPLHNQNVMRGSTLTLSNETAGDPRMTLQSGVAVVMVYPT